MTVVYSMRRDEVIEHMRQAAAAAGIPDDRVRYEAESGEPATTIVARALALRADTIVLGTRARRGLDRLLGSVTERRFQGQREPTRLIAYVWKREGFRGRSKMSERRNSVFGNRSSRQPHG